MTLRRILTFDFLRGIAVFLMVFVHVIQHVYDEQWAFNFDILFKQPFYTIIGVFLLAFLGTWAGLFLLISAAVNSYSLTRKVKKGQSPLKVLKYQILGGFALLIVSIIVECFIGYYGAFSNLFKRGISNFSITSSISRFYEFETLSAIAWSIIILGLIHFFLIQEGGVKRVKRNIIIFVVLAMVTILITPLIWDMAEFVYPGWPAGQHDWPPANFSDFVIRYVFVMLSGTIEPLFPFLGTAFIGAAIGIALAQDRPTKNILYVGSIGGFLLLGLGILFIFQPFNSYFGEFDFTMNRPKVAMYLIETGPQILVTMLFLWLVEFRGSKEFAGSFKRYTQFFRRWGVLALSVYSLQALEFIPRYFLQMMFKIPAAAGGCTWQQTALTVFFVLIFWNGVILLWERINFKGSLEWIIVYATSFGRETTPSRLDVNQVIYNVEPYRLEEILTERKPKPIDKEKAGVLT
ncbi:MAG: DUF1624 domain-containing protein [Candidatus Heimdallarchaeota archaeon]|nr:DUF1624 domain-containing protein [Candidatus Heimdallarchaeota archaeon]